MIQSLDELAETSMRVLDGDSVIALDPRELDGSFVADRIGDDERGLFQFERSYSPVWSVDTYSRASPSER